MPRLSSEDVRNARLEAGWSMGEAARQLKRRSSEPLPTLNSLIRSWKRWETGTRPSGMYQRLLTQLFETPDEEASISVQRSAPTVWRRWLAIELRRLREGAGMSRQDAAQACGWPASKVSYLEDVQLAAVEDDLERLLPVYGVPTHQWSVYFDAASERAVTKGWWQRSDERALPEWASLFAGLEQGATRISTFASGAVPGVLQTFDYAVEIISRDLVPKTRSQVTAEAQRRMDRQGVLARSVGYTCVIDETVLTRMPIEIAADQLHHLATMSERPNINLHVLPADLMHSYAFGPFFILGFPWAGDPGVVYTEHRDGALFLEEPHEVASHSLVFQHLCTLALEADESTTAIRNIAGRVQAL